MLGKPQDRYLAFAKEAEELAERTVDPQEKETWLRVAEGYRQLAGAVTPP